MARMAAADLRLSLWVARFTAWVAASGCLRSAVGEGGRIPRGASKAVRWV